MSKENQAPTRKRTSITIYTSGITLVQGLYALRLAQGKNTFALEGMPTQFVPRSLFADEFAGPGEVTMGPIPYRAANLTPGNQVARSINHEVTVVYGGKLPTEQEMAKGILLNLQGNPGQGATALMRLTEEGPLKGKIRQFPDVQGFIYDDVADGLSNTPALDVTVEATEEGDYEATLLFKSRGLSWNPDYKLIYDEAACRVRWDGSMVVSNGCGASFEDAELVCAAGDIGAARGAGLESFNESVQMAATSAPAPQRGKSVKQARVEGLGNVKLYAVPGLITLADGSSPMVPFFAAEDVPVRREYRLPAPDDTWFLFNHEQEGRFATVLMLKNDEENKLGKPLPGGPVEVLQRDSTGCLRQTGGTHMGDVAVSEEFELSIGNDFDLKATRCVLKVEREVPPLPPAKPEPAPAEGEEGKAKKKEQPKPRKVIYTRHCRIEITSGKKEATEVVIAETLPENCELIDAGGLKEETARYFEARVTVPGCDKTTIEFIVRQTEMEHISEQEAAKVDGRSESSGSTEAPASEPAQPEGGDEGHEVLTAEPEVAFGEALRSPGFELAVARPTVQGADGSGHGPLE
jgi:hypothetical protein